MAKNIEVTLTLNSKDFDRKINSATGSLKRFSTQGDVSKGTVIGLAARLAPLAAGFVAVTSAVNGLGKALGVASKFEDVQVTLSNIVGTAEGGAAALEAIRDVAKELPVSFEELAQSAPGLATVSKTIGELEDNIRLTADIAANFGIPFETAAGQIQRSFSAGAGAADVFREKGVLAAAGFQQGVKVSIDETIAKFREFGVEVEGSAQKLAVTFSGSVNQAGDAITDFQAELGNAFKPEVTALLTELTARFRENETEVLALARSIGESAFNGFVKFGRAVAIAIDVVRKLISPIIQFNDGLKALGTNLPIVATAIYVVVKAQKAFRTATIAAANAFIFLQGVTGVGLLKVAAGITAAAATTAALTLAINEASEAFEESEDATDGALGAFNDLVDIVSVEGDNIRSEFDAIGDSATESGDDIVIAMGNAGTAVSDVTQTLVTALQQLNAFGTFSKITIPLNIDTSKVLGDLSKLPESISFGSLEELVTVLDNLKDEFDITIKSGEEMGIILDVLNAVINDGVLVGDAYQQSLKAIQELREEDIITIGEQIEMVKRLNEAYADQEGLLSFLKTLGQAQVALSQDLATSLVEGESAAKAFQSFFKKLVVQLIADALRLAIIQPILGSLFGVTFGMGGAVTGLTGGGLLGIFGKKELGGPVMKNRPYIVGEKGPELFIPGATGNIVPNDDLAGARAVTYNINAVDARSFRELVATDPEFIFAVTEAGRRRLPA